MRPIIIAQRASMARGAAESVASTSEDKRETKLGNSPSVSLNSTKPGATSTGNAIERQTASTG